MLGLTHQMLSEEIFFLNKDFIFAFCIKIYCACKPNVHPAVSKGEEVQISVVKHYRTGLDENYEISEKWLLDDLEMIDGKEADSVSAAFYYKAYIMLLMI